MLCVYLKRHVSMVKVTITTIQQQHTFYVHFQPGVCSSCTFSSFFWILSSYLLGILSSLVSPPSSIYISCGHIMKTLSFKVENQGIAEVIIRCSCVLYSSFVTLQLDLYWQTIMNGISYCHSFYLEKMLSFNLLFPLLWTPLQIEFSQNTIFNRGHHNKTRRLFWNSSRKSLCQKEIRNNFTFLK